MVAAGRLTVVVVTGTAAVRDAPVSNWLLPWTVWKLECLGVFAVWGAEPPTVLAIAAITVIKTIDVARKSEAAPLWAESLPLSVAPDFDWCEPALRCLPREIRSAVATDRPIACSTELEPTTAS